MPTKYNKRRHDEFSAGLETILNNPQASFLKQPKVFKEIHQQSGMSISAMIKHLGRQQKKNKVETDEEKSKARIEKMEAESN